MLNAIVLGIFIVLQIVDGILTWYGITYSSIGIKYEANPLMIYFCKKMGLIETLVASKTISTMFGAILYKIKDSKRVRIRSLSIYALYGLTAVMGCFILSHILSLNYMKLF